MSDFPRRLFPCDECPIRADNADNPKSKFPARKWRELAESVWNEKTGSPGLDAILFGCHKGEPGTNNDLACAGWMAQFGAEHVAVRIALLQGRLPAEALSPSANWPPLHETWADVVEAQTSDGDAA